MSNFIGRPPFSNSLWVGIETMQFHIAQTKIFLRTPSLPIQGVPMNNLAPVKNCPGGVQGNLSWMPGYLLGLSSWCLVMVVWLFLAVPWVCLRFVIVVIPDHTHFFGLSLHIHSYILYVSRKALCVCAFALAGLNLCYLKMQ